MSGKAVAGVIGRTKPLTGGSPGAAAGVRAPVTLPAWTPTISPAAAQARQGAYGLETVQATPGTVSFPYAPALSSEAATSSLTIGPNRSTEC